MNIFFYTIIFAIGILFGSFYTLAVYRIPKKENITHKHSYCPNCKAKLGFFELIPVFSYIFLGGKCKHCGKKIRIRYLLLEVFSGITFVILAHGLKLNVYNLELTSLAFFIFSILYITCVYLIGGIDKENRVIEKSVLYYGILVVIGYMVYLYTVEHVNMYRYAIYLIVLVILLIIDNIALKKYSKDSYTISVLLLITIMAIFTGECVTIYTIGITILATAIYLFISKRKHKKSVIKNYNYLNENLRIGFFLCCSNILVFLTICNL